MTDSTDHAHFLSHCDFATVIRATPLVSIDFVITRPDGAVPLGQRHNEPGTLVRAGRLHLQERAARRRLSTSPGDRDRAQPTAVERRADGRLRAFLRHQCPGRDHLPNALRRGPIAWTSRTMPPSSPMPSLRPSAGNCWRRSWATQTSVRTPKPISKLRVPNR